MRAVVVDRWMQPSELRVSEIAEPNVGPESLKVEIRAAGCNFFDTLIIQGTYQTKPPFPFTPGGDIAGVVREVGTGVEGFSVGDRVFASTTTGGYAEYSVISARDAYRLPDEMSFEEGAAFPIVYPTSYAALILRANLRTEEILLVHAAAGGVGIAAVQIGKALGARIIATAGGADKLDIARQHGADEVIDYRKEDLVARVMELTGRRGADVIYDSVGGEVLNQSLKCIAWNGRYLVIGFASGQIPEIKANRILLKNISVMGLHWGAYRTQEPSAVGEIFEGLYEFYRKGQIKPVIFKTYPLSDLPIALGALASRKTYGKLVVNPRA